MDRYQDFNDLLSTLHLPILIAAIVLAVSLTRLLIRILGRLVDKALPPGEHERCRRCERADRA